MIIWMLYLIAKRGSNFLPDQEFNAKIFIMLEFLVEVCGVSSLIVIAMGLN